MSIFEFADQLGFNPPIVFEDDIPDQIEVISQNKSGIITVRNIVRFHNSDSKLSVLPPKGNNDLILYVNKKNDKPLLKGKVTRFKDSGITFYDIELVGLGLGKNLRKAVEENRQENPHIIVNDLMNWLGINDASHLETRAILHSWILEYIKEYPSDFVPDTPNGFDNLFELFQLCIELGVIDLSETAGYIADEVFAAFAKAIKDQKLGDHRWNPIPEDKYDPLFPDGSTIKEGILGALGAIGLDTIDNSGNPKVTNTHTGENEYLRGINGLLVSELKQVILWFKNLIIEAVTDATDLAGEAIKLYNAFIVGLINGLIDLLASLVDVLGFIIGLINNDKQNTIIAAINKFIKEFGWDTIKAFIGKIFTNFIKFFDKESYEQAYTIGKLIPKIIEIAIDTYFFVKGGIKVVKKVADLAKDLPEILKQSGKALDDFVFVFTSIGFDKKLLESLKKQGVELKIRLLPSQQLSTNPFKFFDGKEFKVEFKGIVLETFTNQKKANAFLKEIKKDSGKLNELFNNKRFGFPRFIFSRRFKEHLEFGHITIRKIDPQKPRGQNVLETYEYTPGSGRVPESGFSYKIKTSGAHIIRNFNNQYIRIFDNIGTKKLITGDSVRLAKIEYWVEELGQWVAKKDTHTFWPQNWNYQKIEETIREATNNIIEFKGNKYRGITNEGLEIEFYLNKVSKEIETAYIVFK